MDWEAWLRQAVRRPSGYEDAKRQRTERQIRDALGSYGPLKGRPYRVFAKGSYANNTNVRLNYDVDIAVEYNGYFYSELAFELKGHEKAEVGVHSSDDPYTRDEFKADVLGALKRAFGASSVEAGNIAYRIREEKTTLPADVVPCWEYRRYDRIVSGVPDYAQGSRIYPRDGGYIDNFPAQQLENGIKKNNNTGRRYKRMVRALKRLQTKLVKDGALDKELPSYLIECLVYNVDDDGFNCSTYRADMRHVLARIFNATLSSGNSNDWEEVNDLKWLFRGSSSSRVAPVHKLASEAWDALGFD